MTAKKKAISKTEALSERKAPKHSINPKIKIKPSVNATSLSGKSRYLKPDFFTFELRINGARLSYREKEKFDNCLAILEKSSVHLIYRGDKKDRLLEKFNLSDDSFPDTFNQYLYVIGEKGRYFWSNAMEKKQTAFKQVKFVDQTHASLESIFDMLYVIVNEKNYPVPLQQRLQKFGAENEAFIDFFKDLDHKKEFVEKARKAPLYLRSWVRDYYLTLLHQFGKNDFYPQSYMLSATKRISVANTFIRWDKPKDNGIILFGWVPILRNYLLYTEPDFLNTAIKESVGLPTAGPIFKEQHEVTLKGGLLPHYMLGYLYYKNHVAHFEVNPLILNIENRYWPLNGLPVDQHEFWKIIAKTGFYKAFMVNSLGDYDEL